MRIRLLPALFLLAISSVQASDRCATESVILVTLDGVRWQEVFQGIDPAISAQESFFQGVQSREEVIATYGATDSLSSRARLLPFVWTTINRQGQLYGNRLANSPVAVRNPYRRSYPGYSEILTGQVDLDLESNARVPNPNVSLLEFLEGQQEFRGRTAIIASWDAFPAIVNADRYGGFVNAGITPMPNPDDSPTLNQLNQLQQDLPPIISSERYDAVTYQLALEYLETKQPRFFHLALNDPDAFAHKRRYGDYLRSIHQSDRYIERLWSWLQDDDNYRDNTTLIVTTDHGRGNSPETWHQHGTKRENRNPLGPLRFIDGTDETWIAVMGPDTFTLGEVRESQAIYLEQLATTIVSLLGEDYRASEAGQNAGEIISSMIRYGACH